MVTTWGDMLRDLIPDILSRLPVKSLMRFRCVCKSWYALICDPNFIDMHLKFNQNSANKNDYLLIQHLSPHNNGNIFSTHCAETLVEHTRLDLALNRPSFESFKVEGYCNGLICLSCVGKNARYRGHIYLWNPSIQKFKALPYSLPLKGVTFLAFSFVPQVNDYKVLKLFYRRFCYGSGMKAPLKVEIYSLRLNSWKEIPNVIPCQIFANTRDPIVNGVVHWVAHLKVQEDHNYEFILTFDLAEEVFGKLKLPECCRDACVVEKVATVLNKSLCLFVYCHEEKNVRVDVWVMKEYGVIESWTKQFTFDRWLNFPLGVMKNGEIVITSVDGELVSYDPRVKHVKDIRIHGVTKRIGLLAYCIESLALLNEGN